MDIEKFFPTSTLLARCFKSELGTQNKAGYKAILVACRWAGAVLEKVTRASEQEPYAQKCKTAEKVNSRKSGTRVLPKEVVLEVEREAGQRPRRGP